MVKYEYEKCRRCGRPLKSAQSRFIGLGWSCLYHVAERKWSRNRVFALAKALFVVPTGKALTGKPIVPMAMIHKARDAAKEGATA